MAVGVQRLKNHFYVVCPYKTKNWNKQKASDEERTQIFYLSKSRDTAAVETLKICIQNVTVNQSIGIQF